MVQVTNRSVGHINETWTRGKRGKRSLQSKSSENCVPYLNKRLQQFSMRKGLHKMRLKLKCCVPCHTASTYPYVKYMTRTK
jgi:hypothetical protein